MKKRLLSVAVGLAILTALLVWFDTWLVPIAFLLAGWLAIFEGLRAVGLGKRLNFIVTFFAVHALTVGLRLETIFVIFLYMFGAFCCAMFVRDRGVTFQQSAGAFAIAVMVTTGISAILSLRTLSPHTADGRFFFVMALGMGWVCDTFAFIFGNLFGKRKLCPSISPNKTVAGAVGGVLGTVAVVAGAFWLYARYSSPAALLHGMTSGWHLACYAVMGAIGAIVGIIGDLSASFIKRAYSIKDFGNIMPGHGGALDRLDSVLFTSLFTLFAFTYFFKLFA